MIEQLANDAYLRVRDQLPEAYNTRDPKKPTYRTFAASSMLSMLHDSSDEFNTAELVTLMALAELFENSESLGDFDHAQFINMLAERMNEIANKLPLLEQIEFQVDIRA